MSRQQKNNNRLPQKTLRRWHRWVGYTSLFFVLVLSVTGLILNRTEYFGLNQVTIKNQLVTALYGMGPSAPPLHYKTGDQWLSWLDGRLYLGRELIAQNTPQPVGALALDDLIIIGTNDQLALYLTDGSLVEMIDKSSLPGEILALGKTTSGRFIMTSTRGNFMVDREFMSWTPVTNDVNNDGLSYRVATPRPAPAQLREEILQEFQGQGISLYRLILDLHSGNILGSYGSYLMDLAAISLIFLGLTGLMKRRPADPGRRKENKPTKNKL